MSRGLQTDEMRANTRVIYSRLASYVTQSISSPSPNNATTSLVIYAEVGETLSCDCLLTGNHGNDSVPVRGACCDHKSNDIVSHESLVS